MCEACLSKKPAWKGWIDVPPPRLSATAAPWTEVSHVITETLSRVPSFPQPRIRLIRAIPEHPANVTEMHMVCHHGTHVDAPRHFIADGPVMDEIPLERLYGRGVVWHIAPSELGIITPADFEKATPRVEPGDIVYIHTGWSRHVNTDLYVRHPSLSPEAADWLLDKGVKLLGIDCSTPDLAFYERPEDFDFPVHHTLLSNGVLIAEHLTDALGGFAGRRVETMFMALNIGGSDGAPARVVVRPVD